MCIKRMLFRVWVRTLEFITLNNKPTAMCNLSLSLINDDKHTDIITVAFNNLEFIQYQTRLLRKFIQGSYCQIVVDNSTDKNIRTQLYQYCLDNNVAYVGMPKNMLNVVGGSYAHATALNYAYKRIIKKRKPYAFGCIDHDLFPTQYVSIVDKLNNQPIYGLLRLRNNNYWYLSAILSFFLFDFVKDKKVDFMPISPNKVYLDTGGANWYSLYSKINRDKITLPNVYVEELETGMEGIDMHGNSFEFYDNRLWLHTINGSCWKKYSNELEKKNLIRSYLDDLLN